MKKFYIIAILSALFAFTGFAASIHTEAADTSPAIRIYNGYTGTVSIVITTNGAGNNMSVTLDGLANALDGSGNTDTIAELAAAITACTNASGQIKLVSDTLCSLGADSTDGELLNGTYTATTGKWLEIPWDTSAALFYSVYVPGQKYDSTRTQNTLKTAYGTVTGTGDVTLNVYLNGTLAWAKALPQTYALDTNGSPVAVSSAVDLPVDIDIPVGASQSVLVRAVRATTATTGMLGITVE